jgi:phage terminase small subunit
VELNPKQKQFVKQYIIDCNATQAAIRAGYSANTANEQGARLLANASIKKAIDAEMRAKDDKTIATADEVLRYLTSVLRGDVNEECVVVESIGVYQSEARTIRKQVTPKDRNKAAELLAKRYGILTENLNHTGELAVKIVDDV